MVPKNCKHDASDRDKQYGNARQMVGTIYSANKTHKPLIDNFAAVSRGYLKSQMYSFSVLLLYRKDTGVSRCLSWEELVSWSQFESL
jgi:hypothetical protein